MLQSVLPVESTVSTQQCHVSHSNVCASKGTLWHSVFLLNCDAFLQLVGHLKPYLREVSIDASLVG